MVGIVADAGLEVRSGRQAMCGRLPLLERQHIPARPTPEGIDIPQAGTIAAAACRYSLSSEIYAVVLAVVETTYILELAIVPTPAF